MEMNRENSEAAKAVARCVECGVVVDPDDGPPFDGSPPLCDLCDGTGGGKEIGRILREWRREAGTAILFFD